MITKKPLLLLLLAVLPLFVFSQSWKQKKVLKPASFYTRPGTIALSVHNTMFSTRKTAMPPVSIMSQVTATRNFTLGPVLTYFNFRQYAYESVQATRWINQDVRYHECMIGLRAEYHIPDLLQRCISRPIPVHYIDVYIFAWSGYSFVRSSHARASAEVIAEHQQVRVGAGLGARSLFLRWMGLSLEGGYGSYGYCSFGFFFIVR
ncbi:MAG: hypothetical protein KatS3mg031_1383 [Chitinophagales bacterium]|nr:MAG: hypothetical protein KatS3mg031_1383 [Chitinophagales bacterium]